MIDGRSNIPRGLTVCTEIYRRSKRWLVNSEAVKPSLSVRNGQAEKMPLVVYNSFWGRRRGIEEAMGPDLQCEHLCDTRCMYGHGGDNRAYVSDTWKCGSLPGKLYFYPSAGGLKNKETKKTNREKVADELRRPPITIVFGALVFNCCAHCMCRIRPTIPSVDRHCSPHGRLRTVYIDGRCRPLQVV